MRHRVSVVNQLPTRKVYEPIVRAVLVAFRQQKMPSGEVVVTLGTSALLQQLNEQFRNINTTTDVLTFPPPVRFSGNLGDVIINWDMAEIQAKRRGVRAVDEAAMLAVHGALHLAGFDDHSESDRIEMLQEMNKAMKESGLPEESNWESLPHEEPTKIG